MSRFSLMVLFVATALAQSAGMRSVYVLPMTGGLDQYLAEQIARSHVMQVVADPSIADVVMTDRLNEAFGQMLAKLHPRDADPDEIHRSFRASGTKGTIFLVDAKSRQVIWSDYEKPGRSASGDYLVREAERIVNKLQSSLGK